MEKMKKDKKNVPAKQRFLVGEVISDRMDKTVIARVQRTYKDARVNKIVRRFKNYKVHDEQEQARIGDMIEFYQGRPSSKTKYMYLYRVVGAEAVK